MTTPTGAALIAALATSVTDIPGGFVTDKIGYGAGSWDLDQPNVLRANLGEEDGEKGNKADFASGGKPQGINPNLMVLETNIDDQSPEVSAYTMELLLAKGALDVWLTPIVMKKGRAAHMLSVLAKPEHARIMEQVLFQETSTLGIRSYLVQRTALERRLIEVKTSWGIVRVKCAYLNNCLVNLAPEYEDCKHLALECSVPLQLVMDEAKKRVSTLV